MAEPINGTILAKVMRGAPDRSGTEYAWELLKEFFSPAKDAAQTAAGFVSPGPNTLGAAGVAGIRSLLPGSGTYQQELDRYNQVAAPQDSVTDRVPMPGEDQWAFMRRQNQSPAVQREVMQAATMAAPIAVHASPVKWSGQPTRAKAGTGEGGAAYGEGLYATVPSNAKGIDRRYREQGLAEWSVPPQDGKAAVIDRLRRYAMGVFDEQLKHFTDRQRITGDDAFMMASNDPDYVAAMKQADFLENTFGGTLEPWEARDIVARYTKGTGDLTGVIRAPDRGSFHVWDVPDRLLDWDKPLTKQPSGLGIDLTPYDHSQTTAKGWGELAKGHQVAIGGRPVADIIGKEATGKHLAEAVPNLNEYGIQGHTYAGEAGSARTSGIEGDVPNFVIYDDAAIKPLGIFGSADEWLQSDLYRQLKPRIDAEEALRRAGQASPEAYAMVRAMYNGQQR